MKSNISIGDFIRESRLKSGFTKQINLAYKSGISAATISRIESNAQKPEVSTLQALSPLLINTTYEELMDVCGYLNEPPFESYTQSKIEKEYDLLINKLADIRNLFDESDEKAEGHGMEDMIADPYSVAVYAENKMKRLIEENQCLHKKINTISQIIK